MILIHCANGNAGFRIYYVRDTDSLKWFCINDSSTNTRPRTAQGYGQLVSDLVAKATALEGAFQWIVDIPEIF